MRIITWPLIYSLFCLVLFSSHSNAQVDEWKWSGVNRVVAIADIHGAYEAFTEILETTGLTDNQENWSGNDSHLVIIGDVLDRGAGSRKALDLIMKLEEQAPATGGKVHMVLGNHEVMNMVGDLSYVSVDEYSAYIGDEDISERQAAMERFNLALNGEKTFEQLYPPGYFGHRKLFSSAGKYGKWLLNKPVILQVNNTLFAHGGFSTDMLDTTPEEINNQYSETLRNYLEQLSALQDEDILPVETNFYEHPNYLQTMIQNNTDNGIPVSSDILANANGIIELNASPLFATRSPIWYRGNIGCNTVLEESRFDSLFSHLNAERLVIGHTPSLTHEVLSRFNNRLLRADTGMLNSHYKGRASAVIIESDSLSVMYAGIDDPDQPVRQHRQVGARPGNVSDEELSFILKNSTILTETEQEDGSLLVKLKHGEREFDALFTHAVNKRKGRIFIPEVAAYRLDKLLGMDLVPVSVVREIGGEIGALQVKPTYLVSEHTRAERRQGGGAFCSLADQFNLMYIFDILVYNEGRTFEDMRYRKVDWLLSLTGNRKILANKKSRPSYLKNAVVTLPSVLEEELQNLDGSVLTEQLGDVLDGKRIKAILNRRDTLLKSANKSG